MRNAVDEREIFPDPFSSEVSETDVILGGFVAKENNDDDATRARRMAQFPMRRLYQRERNAKKAWIGRIRNPEAAVKEGGG